MTRASGGRPATSSRSATTDPLRRPQDRDHQRRRREGPPAAGRGARLLGSTESSWPPCTGVRSRHRRDRRRRRRAGPEPDTTRSRREIRRGVPGAARRRASAADPVRRGAGDPRQQADRARRDAGRPHECRAPWSSPAAAAGLGAGLVGRSSSAATASRPAAARRRRADEPGRGPALAEALSTTSGGSRRRAGVRRFVATSWSASADRRAGQQRRRGPRRRAGAVQRDDVDQVIDLNLRATIHDHARWSAAGCCRQRSGRIINISSIVGLSGYRGLSVYSATKAALDGFTRVARARARLARDHGQFGRARLPAHRDVARTRRGAARADQPPHAGRTARRARGRGGRGASSSPRRRRVRHRSGAGGRRRPHRLSALST